MTSFDLSLSFQDRKRLHATGLFEKNNLAPSLRRRYDEQRKLEEELVFWKRTKKLKDDLLKLTGTDRVSPEERKKIVLESDAIATTAIRAFGELRKKFGMIRPAGLHNILVNAGIKKEGFCWHWTRDLRERLRPLGLEEYDLLWATAREGTIFENNGLVITPRGRGLEGGIVLDGWRKSGTPFWTRVSTDRYPWKPGSYAGDDLEGGEGKSEGYEGRE